MGAVLGIHHEFADKLANKLRKLTAMHTLLHRLSVCILSVFSGKIVFSLSLVIFFLISLCLSKGKAPFHASWNNPSHNVSSPQDAFLFLIILSDAAKLFPEPSQVL